MCCALGVKLRLVQCSGVEARGEGVEHPEAMYVQTVLGLGCRVRG